MNESRTHKSFSIHSRSSSSHHLIIVSKRVLLQLITSIYHQSNLSDCSSVLSNQSSLTSIVMKSRRDVRTRHLHVIEFVSLFISFLHFLLIIFFIFSLLSFILFASHSQIEYLHRQLIVFTISIISLTFQELSFSLFMKKSVVEEHLQLCFQLRDFFRTRHKFSDLVFTDIKSFISNIINHTIFSLTSKAIKTRSEKFAKKSI